MKMKRKNKIWIILLALILAAAVAAGALVCSGGWDKLFGEGGSSAPTDSSEPVSSEESSAPSSSEPESSEPESSEPVSSAPVSSQPVVSRPVSRPVSSAPVSSAPVTTQPADIISLVHGKMGGLAGTSYVADGIANPRQLKLSASNTEDINAVAEKLFGEIKTALNYEEAKADPNRPAGKPNPFCYAYQLVYVDSTDGMHNFVLNYRFVSTNYNVAAQGYDTNKLVADVCAYLDGLGKTKFDSQTAGEGLNYQAVIVRTANDYETTLNTVKAQVENVSRAFASYDFYYKAMTVSTKGGVEEEALLFCIYNR